MKEYGILLIAVLVAVSGLIAYVGDVLGRWLGRRRVSIFGLRPRHTAMVISVVVGMLIAGWTLGVAMAVSRTVRDAFTRVVALRIKVSSLQRQTAGLAKQQHALRNQVESSRTAAREAQAERAKAESERVKAQKALDEQRRKLVSVSGKLRQKSKEYGRAERAVWQRTAETFVAERKVRSLEQQRGRLEREIHDLSSWSERAARSLAEISKAALIAHADEPLGSFVVDATQSKPEIRGALRGFADGVGQDAKSRGASGISLAVIDRKSGKVAVYRQGAVPEVLANAVSAVGGSVVVQAISMFNAVKDETLWVDFRLFRNRRIFEKGDVIAETVIDASMSEARILASLVSLLRDKVGPQARDKGVLPSPMPAGASRPLLPIADMPVGEVSVEELLNLAREIRRTGQSVRVVARALTDTWTAGPLKVELAVAAS
jgi:uncharacterized protein (DUF3084 family)